MSKRSPEQILASARDEPTRREVTDAEYDNAIPPGFRRATFGDKPTHAMCMLLRCAQRGRVVPLDAVSHRCRWVLLVREQTP